MAANDNLGFVKYGFVRPTRTRQDDISGSLDALVDRLDGYVQVPPEELGNIAKGTWIRYITDEGKYRTGGALMVNAAPTYFVLKNTINRKTIMWSVQLNRATIFIQDEEEDDTTTAATSTTGGGGTLATEDDSDTEDAFDPDRLRSPVKW